MDNLVPQVLIPRWLYKLVKQVHIPYLGPFVNETRESFDTLRHHMYELITVNRAWATGDKAAAMDAALLRNLVEANLAQEDDALQKRLTDEELLSNTFVSTQSFLRSSRLTRKRSDVPTCWTWFVASLSSIEWSLADSRRSQKHLHIPCALL